MVLNQSNGNLTRGKQFVGAAALALGFAVILAPHSAHAATHLTKTHMVSTHARFDGSCTPVTPPCGPSTGSTGGYPVGPSTSGGSTGGYPVGPSTSGGSTGGYPVGPSTSGGSTGYFPATTPGQVPNDATNQTPVVIQQPPTAPINVVLTPIAIDVPQQPLPPIVVQPSQPTFNVTPPDITVNLPAPAQQTVYFAQNPAPVVQYTAPPNINFVASTQPQLPPIIIPTGPGEAPSVQGPCNNVTPSYPSYSYNATPSYPAWSNNAHATSCATWPNSAHAQSSCAAWVNNSRPVSYNAVPCPSYW